MEPLMRKNYFNNIVQTISSDNNKEINIKKPNYIAVSSLFKKEKFYIKRRLIK